MYKRQVVNLYNIIKEENDFGQWTDFAGMLKRDNACQFVIVNKTYSNVVQVILARANIEEKRYSLQNKNEIEKRKR